MLGEGTNLARLGTASAVSVWHNSPDMVPQKAIDGSLDTRWGAEDRHAWFAVEWQKPQAFRGVVIRNYDAPWNKNIPFTCQVWDPSLNSGKGGFRDVQTVTPTSATVVFTFPEVTTTKLRVTNVITFWELEVYDDAQTLADILKAAQRLEIAAAGDLRGHLLGSVSRESGTPVAKAAVEVDGHEAGGTWERQTVTDENGLFSVDLPLGVTGRLDILALDGVTSAKVEVESGDLARQLTPPPPQAHDHISLVGEWDFLADPPAGFPPTTATANWSRIKVPAHWEMEGFVAETGLAAYQRKFTLPDSWPGKRIKFRAEGIYSKAEVWVNGQRMGSHDGGATPVEWDITAAAKPGAENLLTILVTDHSDADDLSAMSFYAHFNLGGIWRPLEVFCVEPAHVARLAVETSFDDAYRDARLHLSLDLVNEQAREVRDAELSVRLFDPKGREVPVSALRTNLSLGSWQRRSVTLITKVPSPEKWSAETPSLYNLKAHLTAAGGHPADVEQRIGFKEVKIVGRTFTLNGQPVKLWGACRHDTDPLAGRAISKASAWRDVELMKGANLNAMRTSHYPPNPEALNAADELGLYVEDEAPFCWANQGWAGRPRNVVGDARLAPLCLQLASELVERDRNHPSVVIWSVCNESAYGGNLELAHQLIKRSDPTRPDSAGQSANLDLATYHNPTSMQRLKDTADLPMPVLFDEGFCVFQGFGAQAQGLDLDPGLRDYWVTGHFEPLQGILRSEHYVGVMIWAWADDAFLVPGKGFEYGRKSLPRLQYADEVYAMPGRGIVGDPMWGLVDGWRRPRPEWWLAKKLFSPIHIEEQPLNPTRSIEVAVENRNYFVNLNEYACRWALGNETGQLRADVPPRSKGIIRITPRRAPASNDVLGLEFLDPWHRLTDCYRLQFAPTKPPPWPTEASKPSGPANDPSPALSGTLSPSDGERDGVRGVPSIPYPPATHLRGSGAVLLNQRGNLDGSSLVRMLGSNTELAFDRTSGGLMRGVAGRAPVLLAGPTLHVMKSYAPLENYPGGWHLTTTSNYTSNGRAFLEWNGTYGSDFTGGFTISMDDAGDIEISYRFRHGGGELTAREIGFAFELPLTCDTLDWQRKAEWSCYPDDEIGQPRGTAVAHPKVPQTVPPGQRPFAQDDHAWGCNDFRSAKRNIYWASLTDHQGAGLRIVSGGTQHIRTTVGPRAISLNVLDYYGGSATGASEWDGTYGNGKVIPAGAELGGTVHLELLPPNGR